jgi:A/G-specific adenine glycosylase
VRAAARAVIERHGGALPRTAEELKALPGLGDYSTNAVLCFAHGQAVPIVDSAIARVLKRLLGFSSDKPAWKDPVAWGVAQAFLDPDHPAAHNYALLDLAALVCVPQTPRCGTCPVSAWCVSAPPRTGIDRDAVGPAEDYDGHGSISTAPRPIRPDREGDLRIVSL